MSKRDDIYTAPEAHFGAFRFDTKVAEVFPDMIQRSVPGYEAILHCIGQLSERYAQENSYCYDLGCSLGAGIAMMRASIAAPGVKIIGIDNSAAMLERCRKLLDDSPGPAVELRNADLAEVIIENASLCLLNFTLQFVPKAQRDAVLRSIHRGMLSGGLLILSEKLDFDDRAHGALMSDLHHDFKRMNGYSDLEIARKRDALENVLIPETFDTHKQRLLAAGFDRVELWFQCFNFASLLAFKHD